MICMCEFSGCCKFYILKMIDLFLKDLLYFFVFFLKGFYSYVMFNICMFIIYVLCGRRVYCMK